MVEEADELVVALDRQYGSPKPAIVEIEAPDLTVVDADQLYPPERRAVAVGEFSKAFAFATLSSPQ